MDGVELKTGTAEECAKAAGICVATFRQMLKGIKTRKQFVVEVRSDETNGI